MEWGNWSFILDVQLFNIHVTHLTNGSIYVHCNCVRAAKNLFIFLSQGLRLWNLTSDEICLSCIQLPSLLNNYSLIMGCWYLLILFLGLRRFWNLHLQSIQRRFAHGLHSIALWDARKETVPTQTSILCWREPTLINNFSGWSDG